MVPTTHARLAASLFSALLATAGCYDHSWTQAVQAKKRAAEAAKGAEVTAGGSQRATRFVGRVRVYASAEYKARSKGWRQRFLDQVDSAAAVLGPGFGVRLEVVDEREWNPSCDPSDLDSCLLELIAHDPADDVDWVVALVGAQPRFTLRFDELGLAQVPGRHFLLRDLYERGEREAIAEAFADMSKAKRKEIYEQRQQHKRLVIFLHEWGHTMGALHTNRNYTILHPTYSDEMAEFSDENMRLIQASLEDRFPFDPAYSQLAEYVAEHDSDEWLSGERDALLAVLQSTPAQAATEHAFLVTGDPDELLEGVSAEDRADYEKATEQLLAYDSYAAWKTLRPLLADYPNCYAIQYFGCGLAMEIGERKAANKACNRSISLAGSAQQ